MSSEKLLSECFDINIHFKFYKNEGRYISAQIDVFKALTSSKDFI